VTRPLAEFLNVGNGPQFGHPTLDAFLNCDVVATDLLFLAVGAASLEFRGQIRDVLPFG